MSLDLDAIEERAKQNLVADYDCEGSARDVLALVGEVRASHRLLSDLRSYFVLFDQSRTDGCDSPAISWIDERLALSREPAGEAAE